MELFDPIAYQIDELDVKRLESDVLITVGRLEIESLPEGLKVDKKAMITGRPMFSNKIGTSYLRVKATNNYGVATSTIKFVVKERK